MNSLVMDRGHADLEFGGADQQYYAFLRYPSLDRPGWAVGETRNQLQNLDLDAADLALNLNWAVEFMRNLPTPLNHLYRHLGFIASGGTEHDVRHQVGVFPHPAVWGSRLADLFPLSSWLRGSRPPAFAAWGNGGYTHHAGTEELARNGAFLVAVGGTSGHVLHDPLVHGPVQVLIPPKDMRRIRQRAKRVLGDGYEERALCGIDLDQHLNVTELGMSVKQALRDEEADGLATKRRLDEEDRATFSWRRAARSLQTVGGASLGDWAVERTARRLRRHCYRLGSAAMKANQAAA
jgi:hypothetical protein